MRGVGPVRSWIGVPLPVSAACGAIGLSLGDTGRQIDGYQWQVWRCVCFGILSRPRSIMPLIILYILSALIAIFFFKFSYELNIL